MGSTNKVEDLAHLLEVTDADLVIAEVCGSGGKEVGIRSVASSDRGRPESPMPRRVDSSLFLERDPVMQSALFAVLRRALGRWRGPDAAPTTAGPWDSPRATVSACLPLQFAP